MLDLTDTYSRKYNLFRVLPRKIQAPTDSGRKHETVNLR